MNTYKDFVILMSDELGIDVSEIEAHSAFRELRNWSSLNALLLVSKIHEQTEILLSPAQLASVTTVEELYKLLK
ncbi:MAG TPA: acyl carrier protein [Crocinitomicaceae bacterium]|nr:acyl carrier protein [Crocinitomicaceae bacterium]